MFNRTTDAVSQTLSAMLDEAIVDCRYNQSEAIKKTAEWIRQDRRFDSLDANQLAREAFECKRSGRQLDLTKRKDVGGGAVGWIHRSV